MCFGIGSVKAVGIVERHLSNSKKGVCMSERGSNWSGGKDLIQKVQRNCKKKNSKKMEGGRDGNLEAAETGNDETSHVCPIQTMQIHGKLVRLKGRCVSRQMRRAGVARGRGSKIRVTSSSW